MTLLVLCNCPTGEADDIAKSLVEERLVACVNVLPEVRSIYRWDGKTCVETESTLLLKTTADAYSALEKRIVELHSYDTPEVIALEPHHVFEKYAAWVDAEVTYETNA